ncbi:MAG: hypothetical protein C4291_14825 [Candidatus Dadabacteria bacterium]
MGKVKYFMFDKVEDQEKMGNLLKVGFWADKAQWEVVRGWPPAYRVAMEDEAALRGLILYVRAVMPEVVILD